MFKLLFFCDRLPTPQSRAVLRESAGDPVQPLSWLRLVLITHHYELAEDTPLIVLKSLISNLLA